MHILYVTFSPFRKVYQTYIAFNLITAICDDVGLSLRNIIRQVLEIVHLRRDLSIFDVYVSYILLRCCMLLMVLSNILYSAFTTWHGDARI